MFVAVIPQLEQTQKELSRLQQLNRNLQDELKHERETHSTESVPPQVEDTGKYKYKFSM